MYDPEHSTFAMLQRVATLCNNSDFVVEDKLDPTKGAINLEIEAAKADFNLLNLQTTGDASESGLIKCVQLLADVKKYRISYPKLFEIKFNSTNKYQIGIHDARKDGEPRPLLLMKGAPERVSTGNQSTISFPTKVAFYFCLFSVQESSFPLVLNPLHPLFVWHADFG